MALKSRKLAEMLATDENFSDEFYRLTNFDEKYDLVKKYITDYTKGEFAEFLVELERAQESLSRQTADADLENVAGGFGSSFRRNAATLMLGTSLVGSAAASQGVFAGTFCFKGEKKGSDIKKSKGLAETLGISVEELERQQSQQNAQIWNNPGDTSGGTGAGEGISNKAPETTVANQLTGEGESISDEAPKMTTAERLDKLKGRAEKISDEDQKESVLDLLETLNSKRKKIIADFRDSILNFLDSSIVEYGNDEYKYEPSSDLVSKIKVSDKFLFQKGENGTVKWGDFFEIDKNDEDAEATYKLLRKGSQFKLNFAEAVADGSIILSLLRYFCENRKVGTVAAFLTDVSLRETGIKNTIEGEKGPDGKVVKEGKINFSKMTEDILKKYNCSGGITINNIFLDAYALEHIIFGAPRMSTGFFKNDKGGHHKLTSCFNEILDLIKTGATKDKIKNNENYKKLCNYDIKVDGKSVMQGAVDDVLNTDEFKKYQVVGKMFDKSSTKSNGECLKGELIEDSLEKTIENLKKALRKVKSDEYVCIKEKAHDPRWGEYQPLQEVKWNEGYNGYTAYDSAKNKTISFFGKYYFTTVNGRGQKFYNRVEDGRIYKSRDNGCTNILREKALADDSLLDKLIRMTNDKDYGNFSCFVKYKEDDDRLLNLFIHGDGKNKSKYVGSTFLIKKKDTVEQFKEE